MIISIMEINEYMWYINIMKIYITNIWKLINKYINEQLQIYIYNTSNYLFKTDIACKEILLSKKAQEARKRTLRVKTVKMNGVFVL